MRCDASLHRLAEMEIDVYLPRGAFREYAGVSETIGDVAAPAQPEPTEAVATVLFVDGSDLAARALGKDLVRSLKFARIACVLADADVEGVLINAPAVVMIGESQARRAGALVPTPRQREIAWLVTGEPAMLRGNIQSRRALWSELKRIARGLAQQRDPGRG